MKSYKILVIALLLKNNEMAKFDDIVPGNKFTRSVEELVEEKYIEEVAVDESVTEDRSNNDDNNKLPEPPVDPHGDDQKQTESPTEEENMAGEKKSPVDIVKGGKK